MATEQHRVIIGLGINENGVIAEATALQQRVQTIFGQLSSASMRMGGLDPATAQRFGQELKQGIDSALRADIRNSPLFQSMRALEKSLMLDTTSSGGQSRYFIAQADLVKAEMDRAVARVRSAIPLGETQTRKVPGFGTMELKGYSSEIERSQARITADRRVQAATNALAKAREDHITEIVSELTRERREARAAEEARARETAAINRRTDAAAAATRREEEAKARGIVAIGRRAAADEAAAQQKEAAAKADRDAAAFRTTYASPDLTTPVGRAQAAVNRAESALFVATEARTAVLNSETRTARQIVAANARIASATGALAAAREKLTTVEASAAGPGGGIGALRQQFMTGFHGRSERGYAEQIGQAFKFSLFYGTAYKLLFALTTTFQQTLQEGIEFQQAVTELRISAGRADESLDALAEQLGQRSVEAGFAPSQGVLVGARSLGLYGVTQASAGEQERVADISARVVSRLALGSTQQPADLQANIAAIAQAFGTGPEGQFRIADLDAYMSHMFGIAPGQSLQAVSEAATVGRAAGFSQEEVTAIAADMISRTGQTPSAVAGFMAQIFSRGGEGSLTSVAAKYGIDPTIELSAQIEQLAAVYKNASAQERAQISAAFGRGKVQNAAIALLQDYDAVKAASAGAVTEAGGAADKAFEERLKNLGGQLNLLLGAFKDFANQLGQTGLLEVIGVGAVALRNIVEAGTDLLRTFNEMKGPVRAAVVAMGLLAIAARSAAASQGAAGLAGLAGGLTSIGGRLGQAGRALAGLLTPTNLAIGGLLSLALMRQSTERLRNAMDNAYDAMGTRGVVEHDWRDPFKFEMKYETPPLTPDTTPEQYRARAAALQAAATDERDAASSWTNYLGDPGAPGDARAHADTLDAEAERMLGVAEQLEAHAAKYADAGEALIHGFDAETLSNDMTLITNAGGRTREQLNALRDSLLGTADAAGRVRRSFDPEVFAVQNTGAVKQALYDYSAQVVDTKTGEDRTASVVDDTFTTGEVQASIKKHLAATGATSLTDLDSTELTEIAKGIVDDSGVAFASETGYQNAIAAIRESLRKQAATARAIAEGSRKLNGPEASAYVDQLVETANAVLEARAETDLIGRVRTAANLVASIRKAIENTRGGGTPRMFQQLHNAEKNLAQVQFDRLEQMRKAAQQNARSRAEVAAIGRRFLRAELRRAVRGGNQDVLAQIIGQAGAGAIRIARQMIMEAINAARAANEIRLQMLELQRQAQGAISELDFVRGGQSDGVQSSMTKDQELMLDMLDNATHSGGGEDNVYLTGSDVPGYKAPDAAEKAAKDRETALERQAALAAANAIRSESSIAAARAEMLAARAAMAEAKKGTVAYYDALGQYYAARNSLTDAILDYRNTQFLLGRDVTDPLVTARAALVAARRKLRSDRGKGADVVAADRLALRQAEAEREAAAFSKRLEAIQTAEQLGRISHQRYINYLENESRRLNRIKDRTYQQQQQLNQIDMLLQEAASAMDAQWNFGDIKLPTPYQVRRYIEETSPDRGADTRGSSVNNTTTIYIDGADTGAVKRIINQHVGQHARVLTTAPRRR